MCGVLSGGVATWNTALDAEFGFQQLIDPSVQVANIASPSANLSGAEAAANTAQQTPQGRARLALAAALGDTPGWFTPLSKEPAPGDAAAQEANQFLWDTQVDFPFIFAFRAELEARAGGNPSWNTGVNYFAQLARSADLGEVIALYHAAGLSLTADLRKLNQAQRISASPSAVRYLARSIAFNGHLAVPVLTMHTTGDGLVVRRTSRPTRAWWTGRATGGCCGRSLCTGPGTARSPRPRPSPPCRPCSAGSAPGDGTPRRSTPPASTATRPRSGRRTTSSPWAARSRRPHRPSSRTAPPRTCARSTCPAGDPGRTPGAGLSAVGSMTYGPARSHACRHTIGGDTEEER